MTTCDDPWSSPPPKLQSFRILQNLAKQILTPAFPCDWESVASVSREEDVLGSIHASQSITTPSLLICKLPQVPVTGLDDGTSVARTFLVAVVLVICGWAPLLFWACVVVLDPLTVLWSLSGSFLTKMPCCSSLVLQVWRVVVGFLLSPLEITLNLLSISTQRIKPQNSLASSTSNTDFAR